MQDEEYKDGMFEPFTGLWYVCVAVVVIIAVLFAAPFIGKEEDSNRFDGIENIHDAYEAGELPEEYYLLLRDEKWDEAISLCRKVTGSTCEFQRGEPE